MDVGIERGSAKAWDSFASHLDLIKHALLPPSGRGNMYLISLAESIYKSLSVFIFLFQLSSSLLASAANLIWLFQIASSPQAVGLHTASWQVPVWITREQH